MDTLSRALDWLIRYEGGDHNDPNDPGGRTKFGISANSYPKLDFDHLTRAGAETIYRVDYWVPAGCGALPDPLAIALFDAAVNQGTVTAVSILQRSLGLKPDGQLGPITIHAATARDTSLVLADFLVARLLAYASLPLWGTYRQNWTLRLFLLQQVCLVS